MTAHFRASRLLGILLIFVMGTCLAGCGLAALPLRATGAAVKAVPIAGNVAAAPLDVTADTID